jgi:hypothetical protein
MVTYTPVVCIQRLYVVEWTTALDVWIEMFNKWGVPRRRVERHPGKSCNWKEVTLWLMDNEKTRRGM